MQKYKYVALNLNRKKVKGEFLAKCEEDLKNQLQSQNLFLVSCKKLDKKVNVSFFSVSSGVKFKEVTAFCRQFAIMQQTGIETINCLEVLKNQPYSSYFKKVLNDVYQEVKAGVLLSDSMKKYKKIFPNLFVSMVKVGELSGSLDLILMNLAEYYETESKIKQKIVMAMSYPIMIMVLLVVVLAVMFVYVVPTFMESLERMDISMPKSTLIVFGISDFVVQNWKYILLGILFIAIIIYLIYRTKKGKLFFDKLKFKIPLIKNVSISNTSSRIARSLGLLLESGMNSLQCLNTVKELLDNSYVKQEFGKVIADVESGKSLKESMSQHLDIFPNILIQMVSVGENTGKLDSVLLQSCKFFEAELETSLYRVTSFIQPIMLLIMASIIGFVFISVYSPMISIMNTL